MEYTDYKQALEYNSDLCSTIVMEECAELIQAISKAKRGKLNRSNLIEEIVDVMISINWMLKMYNITEEELDDWSDFKTQRIVKRLNNGDFR